MNNGLLKISNFFLLALILFNQNYSFSNEIEVAPLLNLDKIEPSYENLDEDINNSSVTNQIKKKDNIERSKRNTAYIGVLNKITAKVSNINVLSGEEVLIYNLKILNRACHISLPEEKPLIAVYLIVNDLDSKNHFSGWMIKDLPSISSMEHPLYDIWVKDCI